MSSGLLIISMHIYGMLLGSRLHALLQKSHKVGWITAVHSSTLLNTVSC